MAVRQGVRLSGFGALNSRGMLALKVTAGAFDGQVFIDAFEEEVVPDDVNPAAI